jgi:hypothetical protein
MSKFEDRLWSELVLDHGPQLASMTRIEVPHRSRRAPAAIGAVALAGTIAAVALTATTGTSPSVAYAVSQSSDGSVSVTIREISGVDGANAQLARLQLPIRVARVEARCSTTAKTAPIPPNIVSNLAVQEREGLAIQPRLIPHGDTLVISAKPIGPTVGLSFGLYRGYAPPCVEQGDSNAG